MATQDTAYPSTGIGLRVLQFGECRFKLSRLLFSGVNRANVARRDEVIFGRLKFAVVDSGSSPRSGEAPGR